MNNQKKIMILVAAGVLAVLVIIGVVVGMMMGRGTNPSDIASVDKDKHLGVDKVLSKDEVNKALGDLGKDAKGPELSGTLKTQQLRGETATYEFTTLEGKRALVDIEVRIFKDKEELQKSKPFEGTQAEKPSGIKADDARYLTPRSVSADDRVALIATKGNKTFKFGVEQNANDGVSINQLAAKRIVLRLAQAANFDAVR